MAHTHQVTEQNTTNMTCTLYKVLFRLIRQIQSLPGILIIDPTKAIFELAPTRLLVKMLILDWLLKLFFYRWPINNEIKW